MSTNIEVRNIVVGSGGTPASSVVTENAYAQSSAVGVGTAYARDDHTHGTPALPTKAQVGLGNVPNLDTSTTTNITDSTNKRFITDAQQTIINNTSGTNSGDNATNTQYSGLATSKENTITAGTTSQYYRGDKTFQTLDKTAVGLANVDNTSDINKPVSTAQQTALNLKQDTSGKDASGGYAGLTLFKINFKNVANTFTSFLTNTNTAARTYTFKDADGTIAFTSDITGTNSGTNTGDVTLAGTPNYITIAGQVITRTLIDLTTHVTGLLPFANIANVATGTIMYRKTAATGPIEAQTLATLKTDLGLTGTNSGDQTITLTGDITGSGTGSFATTLATVNSNVGSFGLAGSVAQFVVNAKGLITSAVNVAISITASQVSDFSAGVRAVTLTGLSLATSQVIASTDTVLLALGYLQAQITALTTTVSGKQNTITLTTTGTSGAATLIGATLNIPNYASGGGSGITRSISSISTNTSAGASATTDYVYLCTATLTITLPTAVGNTNRYAIKNVGGTTTIATTSSQTIDGSTTATLSLQYVTVEVVSDGANWNII